LNKNSDITSSGWPDYCRH